MEKRKAYIMIGMLSLIIVALMFASISLGFFFLVSRNEIAYQELALLDLNDQVLTLHEASVKRERFLNCDENTPFEPDYSGNRAMSASLKKWVEEDSESVNDESWDVLWSNSSPTMHLLEGEFFHYFLVFFNDSDSDYTNGVFWVSGQCWLDLPSKDDSQTGNN